MQAIKGQTEHAGEIIGQWNSGKSNIKKVIPFSCNISVDFAIYVLLYSRFTLCFYLCLDGFNQTI